MANLRALINAALTGLWLALLLAGSAWAEGTLPPIVQQKYRWSDGGGNPSSGYVYADVKSACTAAAAYFSSQFGNASFVSNPQGGRCNLTWGGDPYGNITADSIGVGSCPDSAAANSDGTCTCPAGTRPNAEGTACEKACKSGEIVSQGYYDLGTNREANPVLSQCKNGCLAVFGGSSPEGSATIDGVKHWYAKGVYYSTGDACTALPNSQNPEGTPSIPQDSCDPAKYNTGTLNGKIICTLKGSGEPVAPSPSASSSSTSNSSSTTNPDGSTTKNESTTTQNSDGSSTTTTTTTTTKPDGTSSSTTTSTTTPAPGKGDDSEKSACEKNPSGSGCGGDPASIPSLYTSPDGSKTVSSVLQANVEKMKSSPIFGAVKGFFSVNGGGSCPAFNVSIPYLNFELNSDIFCSSAAETAYLIARSVVLLVASFFAFRVAIDN